MEAAEAAKQQKKQIRKIIIVINIYFIYGFIFIGEITGSFVCFAGSLLLV